MYAVKIKSRNKKKKMKEKSVFLKQFQVELFMWAHTLKNSLNFWIICNIFLTNSVQWYLLLNLLPQLGHW